MSSRASAKLQPPPQKPAEKPPAEDLVPEPTEVSVPMPVDIRSATLTILAVLALIFFLQLAQAVVVPIVLGVLISYALEPIVKRIVKWGLPRPIAAAIVVLLAIGVTGVLIQQLRIEVVEIVHQVPEAARHFRESVQRSKPAATTAIEQMQKAADELQKAADVATPQQTDRNVQRVQIEQPPLNMNQFLWGSALGVIGAVAQVILLLFLVYFLLASGDLYRRKIVKIVGPSLTQKKITVQILEEIDQQIEFFLMIQLFTSVVVAFASWVAFRAIGLEQAGVWALMAGIFNSIPYLGPVIVSGGTALAGFLQFGTIKMALVVSGIALVITSLEGFLLTPWLTSRAAKMNAVAIFVGLLFWGWVWSVWGMLLAVPMLVVVKAVCDHVEDFKGVGELLGD